MHTPRSIPKEAYEGNEASSPTEGQAGFCGSGAMATVRGQGRRFDVSVKGAKGGRGGTGGGRRGEVQEFSRRSRSRLLERLARMDIAAMMSRFAALFVTLTYPADYPSARSSKEHFAAIRRRLERQYGKAAAVWRLGIQARGAPHYHVLIFGVPWIDARWLRQSWMEVIDYDGTGQVQVNIQRADSPKRVAAYVAKYEGKMEAPGGPPPDASGAPAGGAGDPDAVMLDSQSYSAAGSDTWDRPGRFWGIWNRGLVVWAEVTEVSLPVGEWLYALKRTARRYWGGVNKRAGQGFGLYCDPPQWMRVFALCVSLRGYPQVGEATAY